MAHLTNNAIVKHCKDQDFDINETMWHSDTFKSWLERGDEEDADCLGGGLSMELSIDEGEEDDESSDDDGADGAKSILAKVNALSPSHAGSANYPRSGIDSAGSSQFVDEEQQITPRRVGDKDNSGATCSAAFTEGRHEAPPSSNIFDDLPAPDVFANEKYTSPNANPNSTSLESESAIGPWSDSYVDLAPKASGAAGSYHQ